MKYIDFNDLDYDYQKDQTLYEEAPFSGVAFENLPDRGLEETMFLNGVENGFSKIWYSNGQLKVEQYLLNKKNHGIYWEWTEKGALRLERIYEFGILTKEIIYDINQQPSSTHYISEKDEHFKQLNFYRNAFRSNFGNK